MRLLIALFAFLALGLPSLGLPAEARATESHCTETAGMDHGQPQPDHGTLSTVKSCCTALAAALPSAPAIEQEQVLATPAVSMILPVQHGLRREVEVPLPRA